MPVKTPDPIDIYVGARVRLQRELLGLSQTVLGQRLGVTFQQVQKYEKGTTRLGASRLQAAARALGVPVAFFFSKQHGSDVMAGVEPAPEAENILSFVYTREGLALNQAFIEITSSRVRRSVVALIKAMASDSEEPVADDLIQQHDHPAIN